ncbi:hypothetical protein GEMRC1_009974 [Eukaryota sp. GEM-RC1]
MYALQSKRSLKMVKLCNRKLGFKSLSTFFQLASTGKLTTRIDLSPHVVDVSLGSIIYENDVDNEDLSSLLDALKSNLSIKRVQCCGLRSPSIEGVITLFKLLSMNELVIDTDVSLGCIRHENQIHNFDLISCLNALKSKVVIPRVEFVGLRSPRLEELILLFELLFFNNLVICGDIAPHIIDVENAVFCYAPDSYTKITVEQCSSLQRFFGML